MVLSAVKKHLKIYALLAKFAAIKTTTYRISFLVEILVEIGYAAALILFFRIVFAHITNLAGWEYYDILFLLGINIISSEVILGGFYIFNLNALPTRIKDGEIDFVLTKPISSLFHLSMGHPYFSSFISIIPGLYLMSFSLNSSGTSINPLDTFFGVLILICGFVIAYSILVMVASLSFVFTNAESLVKAGWFLIQDFKDKPHNIYTGVIGKLLFYVIPVVFMSSIPALTILKGVNYYHVLYATTLAAVFLYLATKVWNRMIRHYTSASS